MFDASSSGFSRRSFLNLGSRGFGSVALSSMLANTASTRGAFAEDRPSSLHHQPRIKSVIFCFMSGGVSHVDSFDPKPKLAQLHGKTMPVEVQRTQFNRNGNVMASPFKFKPWGQSGLEISDLFPHIARHADKLAVIRSMTSPVSEHAQANFFMHTGFPFMGHPTAGAWCSYGLGSANEELPAYVVLQSGGAVPPHGGVSLFGSGFLPAQYQGSILQADREEAVRNIQPANAEPVQTRRLALARKFNEKLIAESGANPDIAAAIQNYETAFRMQAAVPDLCDLRDESQWTLNQYGLTSDDQVMAGYGRQCLMARRLVERGVRFIELSCLNRGIGAGNAPNPWDQHGDLQRGHRAMALQVDQPIGSLITDLDQRGLLDQTLIVWAGEFGRTPFSQGSNGRDHNPQGFSIWLAGGGVRGGTAYGATDELGYHAVEKATSVYDLWATVLHQFGLDHERLTYRHGGRDFRLTDVHGNVLRDILNAV